MQYYSEKEIERLSKLGVKVLPFVGKIHRKIAIIDRKILWEGSLNILSQNDSREIMRRFDGASSAQQMMTFLKLDKNFHIYIHGNRELIEKGYDEARGEHFYKIYFKEES